MLYHAANGGRHFEPTRYVQMPVPQTVESWTEIQVQQLGDGHAKICVYPWVSTAKRSRRVID
jgi:hypothetical protein